jgi:hypothetical protein
MHAPVDVERMVVMALESSAEGWGKSSVFCGFGWFCVCKDKLVLVACCLRLEFAESHFSKIQRI